MKPCYENNAGSITNKKKHYQECTMWNDAVEVAVVGHILIDNQEYV